MNVSVRRIVRPGEEGNKNGNTISSSFYWRISVNTPSRPPLPLPSHAVCLPCLRAKHKSSKRKQSKQTGRRPRQPSFSCSSGRGREEPSQERAREKPSPVLFPLFILPLSPSPPSSPFLSGSNISPEVVGGKAFFRLFHFRSIAAAEGQWKPPRAAM